MAKWGGNYNCDMCYEYEFNKKKKRHYCKMYKRYLVKGNVPGLWILPCSECHANKTYGGKKKEVSNA